MNDLAIELDNRRGALAEMGEILGRNGISIEGGGAWVVEGRGVALFLSRTRPQLDAPSSLWESASWANARS
jgi:hypothetical protein